MQLLRCLFLLLSLATLAPAQVWARCEGAVVLANLQNAYDLTLRGGEQDAQVAARALLVLAGGQSGETLGRLLARSGADVDAARLSDILIDARDIASTTLNDSRDEEVAFRHGLNIAWLSELVASAGCQQSRSAASLTPVRSPDARSHFRSVKPPDAGAWLTKPLTLLLVVALSTAPILGYVIHRSFFMRKRQVERLPRYSILLPLDLTFTNPEGEMEQASGEALDISQGGLKIRWEDPPPPQTLTTISLLGIQRPTRVIWSNPHYAGVMFEEALTKPELKSLKESHAAPED